MQMPIFRWLFNAHKNSNRVYVYSIESEFVLRGTHKNDQILERRANFTSQNLFEKEENLSSGTIGEYPETCLLSQSVIFNLGLTATGDGFFD